MVAALGELGNIELPTGRDNKLTEQTSKPNQSRAELTKPARQLLKIILKSKRK